MESQETIWAVVELMGHVRTAGVLTEEEKFGNKLGRIDIPQEDGSFVTQFFGGGSVYRITVVTEAVARQVAKGNQPQPVSAWDYPKQIAGRPIEAGDAYGHGRDEDDEDMPY